ncbi:MAG: hypothetical protein OEY67_03345 [Gammaproteobacteria bacterium]|nr:hypothetical protein [Gammaproteobacteria bacterium]
MNLPFEQIIRLLINEAFQYRRAIVSAFAVISLAFLSVGLVWPKIYTSTSTIFVEQTNVINPLMEGAAVTADATNQIRIAQELLFSRKTMSIILQEGGWLINELTPVEQEKVIQGIQGRTSISMVGRNLLKIEYHDDLPERAFAVVTKYTDTLISRIVDEKAKESKEAFEFIDQQVRDYHDKLIVVEGKIKDYRSSNPDATPGSDTAVNTRINRLLNTVETTTLELQEEKIKKESLERQLSGEAEVTASLSHEGQLRTRIGELQTELETLLLTYHESYPDVVRIRQQINDLKATIEREKVRRLEAKKLAKAGGQPYVDEGISNNPLYQQLRSQLSATKTNIETLTARLNESQKRLDEELERSKRIHGGEAAMTELTRDYQVNREIYQDLLRRRENARVTMNLNMDRQKISIRVQEPPLMPVQPSGLRFIHFVLVGMFLGFAIPVGVLYGFQQVDPRIRAPGIIVERLKLPVIADIPHLSSPAEIQAIATNSRWLAVVVIGVGVIYFVVALLKVTGML